MKNKTLINKRNDITQGWKFCSPSWKRKEKKENKKLLQHVVFVFGHPSKY